MSPRPGYPFLIIGGKVAANHFIQGARHETSRAEAAIFSELTLMDGAGCDNVHPR